MKCKYSIHSCTCARSVARSFVCLRKTHMYIKHTCQATLFTWTSNTEYSRYGDAVGRAWKIWHVNILKKTRKKNISSKIQRSLDRQRIERN